MQPRTVSFRSAQAALVGPGQSVSTSVETSYTTPGPSIAEQFLADQLITFTPVAGSPTPVTPITLMVSLVNRVYRESNGNLDFQLTSPLDRSGLFADGFSITSLDYTGFTTDAHALGANQFSRDLGGNVTVSGPNKPLLAVSVDPSNTFGTSYRRPLKSPLNPFG